MRKDANVVENGIIPAWASKIHVFVFFCKVFLNDAAAIYVWKPLIFFVTALALTNEIPYRLTGTSNVD